MQLKEEGVDQAELDAAAVKGFGNALFEYDQDEISEVVEEFILQLQASKASPENPSIVSKLRREIEPATSAPG